MSSSPWIFVASVDVQRQGVSLASADPPAYQEAAHIRLVEGQYTVFGRTIRPGPLHPIVHIRPDMFRICMESNQMHHVFVNASLLERELAETGELRRELELMAALRCGLSLLHTVSPPSDEEDEDDEQDVVLHPWQRQALRCMRQREEEVRSGQPTCDLPTVLPLGSRYGMTGSGRLVPLDQAPPAPVLLKGGLLADEGRSGKKRTVAHLLLQPSLGLEEEGEAPARPSLVVTSALRRAEWEAELAAAAGTSSPSSSRVVVLTYQQLLAPLAPQSGCHRHNTGTAFYHAQIRHWQDVYERRQLDGEHSVEADSDDNDGRSAWVRRWDRVVLDGVLDYNAGHLRLAISQIPCLDLLQSRVRWLTAGTLTLRSAQLEIASRLLAPPLLPSGRFPLGPQAVAHAALVRQRGEPLFWAPHEVQRVRMTEEEKLRYLAPHPTMHSKLVSCVGLHADRRGMVQRLRIHKSLKSAAQLRQQLGTRQLGSLERQLSEPVPPAKRRRLQERVRCERQQVEYFSRATAGEAVDDKSGEQPSESRCCICLEPGYRSKDGGGGQSSVYLRCGHSLCLGCLVRTASTQRPVSDDGERTRRQCPVCRCDLGSSGMHLVGPMGTEDERKLYGSKLQDLAMLLRSLEGKGERAVVYLSVGPPESARHLASLLGRLGCSAEALSLGSEKEDGKTLAALARFQRPSCEPGSCRSRSSSTPTHHLVLMMRDAPGLALPAENVIFYGSITDQTLCHQAVGRSNRGVPGSGALNCIRCHQLVSRHTIEEMFMMG